MKNITITLTQEEANFIEELLTRLGNEIDEEMLEIASDENGDVDEDKLDWGRQVMSKLP